MELFRPNSQSHLKQSLGDIRTVLRKMPKSQYSPNDVLNIFLGRIPFNLVIQYIVWQTEFFLIFH